MELGVIGVPMDLGANRRGTDMGPSAIRYAGLCKALTAMHMKINDIGNLHVPVPESVKIANSESYFLEEIVGVCEELGNKVSEVMSKQMLPLVLGGDHSITIGTIAGVRQHVKAEELGLLWFDAHGDFNTFKSSETGNVHGMSLAALTGRGKPELVNIAGIAPKVLEERTVLIGVRDLDEQEKKFLKDSKVTVFTMEKIDRMGIGNVVKKALEIAGSGSIHVSFDLDVLDPSVASGVGTPVTGGLSYREAHLALELVAETGRLTSLEMVEVNPIIDYGGNRTAKLAVELITSALGKRIFY